MTDGQKRPSREQLAWECDPKFYAQGPHKCLGDTRKFHKTGGDMVDLDSDHASLSRPIAEKELWRKSLRPYLQAAWSVHSSDLLVR